MPDGTPERDEDGQFTARVPDEEILDAVRDLEPAGTADVGEAVGLARQNADYRLRRLEEAGCVDRQKIGPTLVWSIADGDSTEPGGES
jgi:predicted transcriptional regulator